VAAWSGLAIVIGCLLAACGRVAFDPRATDGDGGAPDVIAADAMQDAYVAPTGPFGTAIPISELNTGSNKDDPSLTGDLLELYFDSNRPGGLGGGDLWVATRTSTADPWSTPTNLAVLNSSGDDATPAVSADGLTLHYVTARAGALGGKDLYVATRASRSDPWSGPVHLPTPSTTGDEAGPSVSEDGLALYFGSDLGGNDHIRAATRANPTDAWGASAPIPELDTAGYDGEPWINATRTFVVFSSDRPGGAGGQDLWAARRASPNDPWDPPTRLAELCTAGNDTDPWLSPDERVIVFARGGDLYMATR
jgi:hypothetical protein